MIDMDQLERKILTLKPFLLPNFGIKMGIQLYQRENFRIGLCF